MLIAGKPWQFDNLGCYGTEIGENCHLLDDHHRLVIIMMTIVDHHVDNYLFDLCLKQLCPLTSPLSSIWLGYPGKCMSHNAQWADCAVWWLCIKNSSVSDTESFIMTPYSPLKKYFILNIFQGWIFFRGEYFSGVNIFQEWIFFRGDYFSGLNIFQGWIFSGVDIFQGWIFFRGDYFSGVNIFQGWIFFRCD